MPGARRAIAGDQWARSAARDGQGWHLDTDNLHHRSWRYSDDGARDESGRGRVPHQAISRAGSFGRDPASDRARPRGAKSARRVCRPEKTLRGVNTSRKRSDAPGCIGATEQASGRRVGDQRNHGQEPERPRDAEDEGGISRGFGKEGRAAGTPNRDGIAITRAECLSLILRNNSASRVAISRNFHSAVAVL